MNFGQTHVSLFLYSSLMKATEKYHKWTSFSFHILIYLICPEVYSEQIHFLYHMIQPPISGYLSKRTEIKISKRYQHSHVHSSTIHNCQEGKTTYSLVDRWVKKMWYTYDGIFFSIKKEMDILQYMTTWVDLKEIMLNEISHSQKDRYFMILLICNT